jgi:hypothetical protein
VAQDVHRMPPQSDKTSRIPGQLELFITPQPAAGAPFNPWYELCGFFPDEVVSRQTDISTPAKAVYQWLIRIANRNAIDILSMRTKGTMLISHQRIAQAHGISIRSARYARRQLEDLGLIRATRIARTEEYDCEFLWHPLFNGLRLMPAEIANRRSLGI